MSDGVVQNYTLYLYNRGSLQNTNPAGDVVQLEVGHVAELPICSVSPAEHLRSLAQSQTMPSSTRHVRHFNTCTPCHILIYWATAELI